MSIKVIATDLDGTFYHRDLSYDKVRFLRLYEEMKKQGIHFVVASGNQYFQLVSFFEEMKNEITFVSENGAYIVDQGKEMFSVSIAKDTYDHIVSVLKQYPSIMTIICGKNSAYILDTISDEDYNLYIDYFPVMKKVKSFDEIDDQILKFALVATKDFDDVVRQLQAAVDESMSVVTSGHECIDLIVKGVHKGNALKKLMEKWNVTSEEVLAFGDAENDLEMLKLAKYGYVMENGSQAMLEQFPLHAPHHELDGVLEIIEQYLMK